MAVLRLVLSFESFKFNENIDVFLSVILLQMKMMA